MKQIKVLGPGCPRCERLVSDTRRVADELGIDYEFEKITDITKFIDYGLMMTPGLVVDGKLVVQGKVPSEDEIKGLISQGGSK